MDRPYRVIWQPGEIVLHASSPEEAIKSALKSFLLAEKVILICARPLQESQE